MAPLSKEVVGVNLKLLPLIILCSFSENVVGASWCVARNDASDEVLQLALDYACASGADCTTIQQSGLCFLPNTLTAHASYAFNSYFQLKAMAPGSCNFSGTSTIAKTDPSYGSCVYPSSLSTARGTISTGTPGGGATTNPTPTLTVPSPPGATSPLYSPGGLTPGTAQIPDPPNSVATSRVSIMKTLLHGFLIIFLN
ncbi:hypothetical protein LIER_21574 [Lithospermum erythrorhizon]|uniref:X8 domain-containing protein n=1 Tax=Lithospermum erythrorhizon TaxID=34254 RepID=A0AAV3QRR9_LITER